MNRDKKTQILINSTKSTLLMAADFFYILAFCILTIFEFLDTVQLWDEQRIFLKELESGRSGWAIILLMIVVVQYLCSDGYNFQEYLMAVCILGLGFKAASKSETFIMYILLLVGARRFSFKKLMWIYFGIISVLIAFTVIGSQAGWVEYLIFDAGNRGDRMAFGFVYATDCAAHFLFWAMTYWCVRGEKMHFMEAGIFGILAYVTGKYCKARFSTGLLLLIIVIAVVYYITGKMLGEEKRDKFVGGRFSAFLVISPLVTNLIIHVLSFVYTDKWSWIVSLNQLVSSRLSLTKIALDVYGIGLWGNEIIMKGNGGRTTFSKDYYFIDSSYLLISMEQGLILLAIFLVIFTMACLKARRVKLWIPLMICGVISLHGMFEHHAFQLAYNPFLFMAFAELQPVNKKNGWIIKKGRQV